MANQFSNKCIRYSVDPDLLNQGIPVDQLPKQNIREFQYQESIADMNYFNQSTKRLKGVLKSQEDYRYTQKRQELELELSPKDYSMALSGGLISISDEVAKSNGKKFRLVNKATSSYVMRTLTVINGKGLWR